MGELRWKALCVRAGAIFLLAHDQCFFWQLELEAAIPGNLDLETQVLGCVSWTGFGAKLSFSFQLLTWNFMYQVPACIKAYGRMIPRPERDDWNGQGGGTAAFWEETEKTWILHFGKQKVEGEYDQDVTET